MKNEYREWIAERLKELRATMNTTQAAFAARAGTQEKKYARYEQGHCQPSIFTLKKICKAHNITIDQFLEGSPE